MENATQTKTEIGKVPAANIRLGRIQASIWENPSENGPYYIVSFERRYQDTEGNGKLLNYMAAGLPTVAFDSPVAREFLGTEGSLISPNADALAESLLELLGDPDRRTERGLALRRRAVERFPWEAGARRIESVYDELLG